jgi:DNA mismatch repair protein MSH2
METLSQTFLLQIGAKECYSLPLDEKDIASRRLFDVLDRCQVSVTSRKRADFDPKNIEQDLKRLLGSKYYNAIRAYDVTVRK